VLNECIGFKTVHWQNTVYFYATTHMILPCFIGSLSRDEVSNSCTVVLLSFH